MPQVLQALMSSFLRFYCIHLRWKYCVNTYTPTYGQNNSKAPPIQVFCKKKMSLCQGEWTRKSRFVAPNLRGAVKRGVDLAAMNLHILHPFSNLTCIVSVATHFILIFYIQNCIYYMINYLIICTCIIYTILRKYKPSKIQKISKYCAVRWPLLLYFTSTVTVNFAQTGRQFVL